MEQTKRMLVFDTDVDAGAQAIELKKSLLESEILNVVLSTEIEDFKSKLLLGSWDVVVVNFHVRFFLNTGGLAMKAFIEYVQARILKKCRFIAMSSDKMQRVIIQNFQLQYVGHLYNAKEFAEHLNMTVRATIEHTRPLEIREVLQFISEETDIPMEKIVMRTKKREIVSARQITCYFCKKFSKKSLKVIGWHLGGRDHTTVIHSNQTVLDLMDSDSQFRQLIYHMETKLIQLALKKVA